MKSIKTLLMLAVLAITLAATSSCRQTIKGAGEDIENAGDAVRDATN